MKIKIEQDQDPESPREYDNLGKMICFHGRYSLGDEHDYRSSDYNGWEEMGAAVTKEEDAVVALPLYLYDHGGITMSTNPCSCRWDSGQVGIIIATREDVLKEFSRARVTERLRERVERILRQEVEVYNQYLTGDVWGFVVEDDDGEHLDSCWGLYGREYCEQEANEAAKRCMEGPNEAVKHCKEKAA